MQICTMCNQEFKVITKLLAAPRGVPGDLLPKRRSRTGEEWAEQ